MRHNLIGAACVLATIATVAAPTADGHFLWVDEPAGKPDAKPSVVVSFSEDAAPGSARLAAKTVGTKAWLRKAGAADAPLELRLVKTDESGYLAADTDAKQPFAVDARWEYGIFRHDDQPILLNYYASHIAASTASDIFSLAPSAHLLLQIVPRKDEKGSSCEVLWEGHPAVGCQVVVSATDNSTSAELETDAAGRVRFDQMASGHYALRARKIEKRAGQKDGQPYEEVHHYATLTVRQPAAATDDTVVVGTVNVTLTVAAAPAQAPATLTAEQVLDAARNNRATWEDFPGCSADLTIRAGAELKKGTCKIGANGDVQLIGFDGFNTESVRNILETMVQHRTGGAGPVGAVSFVEGSSEHPLGPLIRFEEDEELHSAYRVRDNVVTEVNREMGPLRFTISVLDVHRNPAGKYLPTCFNVSFWDKASGQLKSSETHLTEWVRTGTFELPQRVVVLRAEDGKRDVIALDFSNYRLLDAAGK